MAGKVSSPLENASGKTKDSVQTTLDQIPPSPNRLKILKLVTTQKKFSQCSKTQHTGEKNINIPPLPDNFYYRSPYSPVSYYLCLPVFYFTLRSTPIPHCLSDVQLIPPCDRILLEMTYSDLYKWAIKELRTAVMQADMKFKSRGINPAIPPVDTSKVALLF